MKISIAALLAAFALVCSTGVMAQDKKEEVKDKMTSQQGKMATCNKDAEGKKGDERKAFMKECLSAGKPATQQEKMKMCNKDATGMKGDERKAFMKDCLKK